MYDLEIDLHGLHKDEAITKVNQRLSELQRNLDAGILTPSSGDGHNHIIKVVSGAGKHSKENKAVLKVAIPEYLKGQGYELHDHTDDGVVLLRMFKR